MKLRKARKQFWWTWHHSKRHQCSTHYGWFDWGVGRIKHQHKDTTK